MPTSSTQLRNREIAELLRRLDDGRLTIEQCVERIRDAIEAAKAGCSAPEK